MTIIAERQLKEYIVILFIGGGLALNYPLLALVNRLLLPLGIPLLYFYIFLVWLLIIVVMASIVENPALSDNFSTDQRGDD